jgi:lysophospholipase L1-like esterase
MESYRTKFKKLGLIAIMICLSSGMTIMALNTIGRRLLLRNGFPLVDPPADTNTGNVPCFTSGKSALIYELTPGFNGNSWDSSFNINSAGFRGKELLPLSAGRFRILALGDSCTFGTGGLETKDTYPAILENLLNARFGEGRFEVINAGMPGFSTVYGLLLSKEHQLAQLKPDLVIICYGWNDHKPAVTDDRSAAYARVLKDFFRTHFMLYRYITIRFPPEEANPDIPKRTLKVSPYQYKYYLARIIDLFEKNKVKVIVMTAPWENRLFNEGGEWTAQTYYFHPRYVDMTKQLCLDKKVELVDMFSLFISKRTANPLDYFSDPFHYNKNGSRLIADKLSEVISVVLKDRIIEKWKN